MASILPLATQKMVVMLHLVVYQPPKEEDISILLALWTENVLHINKFTHSNVDMSYHYNWFSQGLQNKNTHTH